jgi:hypothetical protein
MLNASDEFLLAQAFLTLSLQLGWLAACEDLKNQLDRGDTHLHVLALWY